MHIHISHHFAAAPEAVWARFSDHAGMVNWAGVFKATLAREGQPERDGVGAVRRLDVLPGVTIVEEVTGFEPPRRLTYRLTAGLPGLAHHAGETRLLPDGSGGTRLEWDIELELRPLHPSWFAGPLVKLALQLGLRRALSTLDRQLRRS
jgi:hypothetical protein